MAADLTSTLGVSIDSRVVHFALQRLRDKHLLRADDDAWGSSAVSRRDALSRLGRTAVAMGLLPIVATLVAPTPTGAQSELAASGCEKNCSGTCMSVNACNGDPSCKSCTGARPCGCPGSDVCCRPT